MDIEKLIEEWKWVGLKDPQGWGDFRYSDIRKLVAALRTQQETLDLYWSAIQRATKEWQSGNPGNDMVWPDLKKLILWLMDENRRLDQVIARLGDDDYRWEIDYTACPEYHDVLQAEINAMRQYALDHREGKNDD